MEYSDLSSLDEVSALSMPEFNLRTLCMYDLYSLRQGIDPDNPPKFDGPGGKDQGKRKMSLAEYKAMREKQMAQGE